MKHYGDITKINGAEAPVVDIITGGSPCQDLSVAGKRAGLAGERSGLFMEQMRIVKEMRERERATGRTGWMVRPRYMVWENVPGAFSSGNPKGADFAAVIEEIIKVAEPGTSVSVCVPNGGWTKSGCYYAEDGSWSIAWRVHDAQFWGVPQRRKRIALVADFGGLSAPEILFERKGLSGDSEQSGEAGEETAGAAGDGVEGAGGEVAATITATYGTKWNGNAGAYNGQNFVIEGADNVSGCLKTQPHGVCDTVNSGTTEGMNIVPSILQTSGVVSKGNGEAFLMPEKISSLTVGGGMPGQGYPCVLQNAEPQAVYCLQGNGIDRADTAGCNGRGWREDVSYTLNTIDRPAVYAFDSLASNSMKSSNPHSGCRQVEVAKTLDCFDPNPSKNQGGIAIVQQDSMIAAVDCRNGTENPNINGTLQAKEQGGYNMNSNNVCRTGTTVRRLTPLECERLQGYPDGWTDIGEWVDSNGKKHGEADSPRYKALGNSIALPFWQWMARRICAQYERPVTMASLFDGIGGFPLVFQRCGAVPVWASEIEEFPIAVTKVRFPDESV